MGEVQCTGGHFYRLRASAKEQQGWTPRQQSRWLCARRSRIRIWFAALLKMRIKCVSLPQLLYIYQWYFTAKRIVNNGTDVFVFRAETKCSQKTFFLIRHFFRCAKRSLIWHSFCRVCGKKTAAEKTTFIRHLSCIYLPVFLGRHGQCHGNTKMLFIACIVGKNDTV